MPTVEIDTLQRLRDMQYDNGFGNGIFQPGRLTNIEAGGQDYLIMAGENDAIGVATVGNNGALDFVDAYGSRFDRLDGYSFGNNTIASIEKGGSNYVYLSGSVQKEVGNSVVVENGLLVLKFDANGLPRVIQQQPLDGVPQGYGVTSSFGSDPKIIKVSGRDILISTSDARTFGQDGTFETFQIRNDGTLKPLESTKPAVVDFEINDVVSVGGKAFVVGFGAYDDAPLQVLRLFRSGSMEPVFELPTSDTAIYNRITSDIETVQIGDRSFVIVPEVTAGTILVYEIMPTGRLELVEQEQPGIGDLWGAPEGIEVFEQDGNTYIATGGYGRSIGIFQVSDGGALIEVDEFQPGTPLGRTYDLDVRDIGGNQFIFSSSGALDEIRALRFVPLDESITGTGGRNVFSGTVEDDQIYGRGGNDGLRGLAGDDLIEGGYGADKLFGGAGRDNLFGGAGKDQLFGGTGDDFLFGDASDDQLFGNSGNDYANGGQGNDRVTGGSGNDRVFGGDGNDFLKGGAGNDVLTDGRGLDQMEGGSGNDIFVFWKDTKRDVIRDYEDGQDRIDLTEFGPNLEFSDLTIRQSGQNVIVSGMGDSILVKSASGQIFDFELSLGDFIFA